MSPQQNPILVTGATGKQGGATARRLLADGVAVRALVRDPEAPAARALADTGAELVTGDFDAPATLDAAVAGARGVFLVPPAAFGPNGWDAPLEAARGTAVIDAAIRAGVEQIVFTGVASMSDDSSWGMAGKGLIEDALAASGLRYTVLRPVRFMENYVLRGSPVDGIIDGVHKHLFPADRPLQMIAIDDIAAFAALAFADPERFHGRTLELAGDAITPAAAVAAISRITGHPVRYVEATQAEADALGEQLGNTWRLIRRTGGWHADITALRELHPALNTLESWLTATGSALIKAQFDNERRTAVH
ncbi:NmrA/HSCARG family protein [Nocardia sp. NBC_00565]|uniref:NmrA/HSCARG family protein n=1 Tax=Nocardia sp. NBC_00565 TaxID=2975993 RepID=UPI002E81B389|nr:NmrA/HSCARG family protein [Nocardia sp. NBC_00565]WUB99988.1 NmrA/HSCARG family protein [Nocardia sp. NBC_00565]